MIPFEADGDGVMIALQAQPKARKNRVTGIHDGRLKVAVTEAPERGKANQAIIKVLAVALDLKKSQLTIVAGESSPRKKLRVTGISADSLIQRIAVAVEESS